MKKKHLSQKESTLEIREVFSIIWKRKWILILPIILVTAGAFGISYTLTPQYDSSIIVQIDAQVRLLGELQGLVGNASSGRRTRSTQRDKLNSIFNEITSSQYVRMLNDRLSLGDKPEIQKQAQIDMLMQPDLSLEQAVINLIQKDFKDNIKVMWASGDQVKIVVQATNPVRARNIADNIGDIYISEKLKQELSQIRSSQNFSDIQLVKFENQLADRIKEKTDLEQELLTVKLDEGILSESNNEEILSEIDRADQQIADSRSEEQKLQKTLINKHSLTKKQLALKKSQELKSLESDLKDRLGMIGDLMVKYLWRDPQITSFKVRLNDIQTAIERENKRLVNQQFTTQDKSNRLLLTKLFDTRANLNFLYIKKPYLKSGMDELRTKANLLPEYNARLAELNHEIAAITELRDRFRRQQQISSISQALARDVSPNIFRIVEPAKLALRPVSPNRKKITVMGLLLGLIIGGAVIILVELFDNSFRNVDEAEDYLDLPVLGIVPGIEMLKKV